MARKLALIAVVLGLGLALWLWKGSTSSAVPLVAPETKTPVSLPAHPAADDAKIEVAAPVVERHEAGQPALAATTTTRLVVLCVARSNQQPLAGVHVLLVDPRAQSYSTGRGIAARGKLGEKLITGTDGRVEFEVEPGLVLSLDAVDQAHFVSEEGIEQVPALAAGETREIKLEHETGEHAHFCGLVIARADGAPLPNAEIRVDEQPRTSTDSFGRFELDFAAHQAPWIRVECKGFAAAIVRAEPGHESAGRARRVLLEREASLVITLQVPEGQAAVRTTLHGAGHDLVQDDSFASARQAFPALSWSADADAQRICRFEELPPGVRLDAEVLGSTGVLFRTAEPIVLQPGEEKHLEWDLRGAEIVGHVYEADGKPASGVQLWLRRGEHGYLRYEFGRQSNDGIGRAKSAEDGSFRFGFVSPGTWILAPQLERIQPGATPADAIAPVPIEVTIEAGEASRVVDVHLSRGLYICGTLLAPDGISGVPGFVSARAATGAFVSSIADGRGQYVLGPLAPGAFELTSRPSRSYLASLPITAEAGARDLLLRARAGAEVAGRVVDASGAGVQAAITIGGENGSMMMTRTQADGRFRIEGFEPGRCTLMASTSGAQVGELPGVVLEAGAPLQGLEIVLKPGATLRIRYEGTGVGQMNVLRARATILGDGLEGGLSLTHVVPPGRITVVFHYPGVELPEEQELDIVAGEERELLFKAPGGK